MQTIVSWTVRLVWVAVFGFIFVFIAIHASNSLIV